MRTRATAKRSTPEPQVTLTIKNVRTLAGLTDIPIRPLTFLVGENSTGKTSILACLASAMSHRFPDSLSLSGAPYHMGGFDTIATAHFASRATKFGIGLESRSPKADSKKLFCLFRDNHGLPELAEFKLRVRESSAHVVYSRGSFRVSATLEIGGKTKHLSYTMKQHAERVRHLGLFREALFSIASVAERRSSSRPFHKAAWDLVNWFPAIGGGRPMSIAPIRSKPKRTYDEVQAEQHPEGNHIPYTLASKLGLGSDKQSRDFHVSMTKFGKTTGLYDGIRVRRLGRHETDPFQIRISKHLRETNLVDVGYGVSQSLPLAVESILCPPRTSLLIQQPEVHMHPSAQAGFASLMCELRKTQQKRFVIETHSDYILDRIRRHVASGDISASDVSILYLESVNLRTVVHVISLDSVGNIINPPKGYRQFFLDEQTKLLEGR